MLLAIGFLLSRTNPGAGMLGFNDWKNAITQYQYSETITSSQQSQPSWPQKFSVAGSEKSDSHL